MSAFLEAYDGTSYRVVTSLPGTQSYPTDVETDQPRTAGDVLHASNEVFASWDDDWQTPTLLNGWVNYEGSPLHARAKYRKLPGGMVQVQGLVRSGTATSGIAGTVFILPAGYRPEYRIISIAMCANGAERLDVLTTGEIFYAQGGSSSWQSIQLNFYAGA